MSLTGWTPRDSTVRQPHKATPVQQSSNVVNCRRVAEAIALGHYGKVLSAGRSNDTQIIGTVRELERGSRRNYQGQGPCRLCKKIGTSGRGLCFRCELECSSFLHLL